MARLDRLPPPPKNPTRSPPVVVSGEEEVLLEGAAGPIEARVVAPADARLAVLVLHPHPLYGGSMHSPVPLAIVKALAARPRADVAVLRFNFRGVGASAGEHDSGRGEIDDALVALTALRRRAPRATPVVCGHSFGSWVGLRAAALRDDVERVALVAPSTRFFEFTSSLALGPVVRRAVGPPGLGARLESGRTSGPAYAGRVAIFIGDQDEFCDVSEARALGDDLRAEIHVLDGFDHHFLKSRRKVADRVVTFLEG